MSSNVESISPMLFLQTCAVTILSPFYVLKLRLQCQNELKNSGRLSTLTTGPKSCFALIRKNERRTTFWQGNLTFIILNYLNQITTSFFFPELKTRIYHFDENFEEAWRSSFLTLSLGLSTMFFSIIFTFPLEFARTRLINNVNKTDYKGLTEVFKKTIKTDGIPGLYRGFWAFCLQITLFRSIETLCQDFVFPKLSKKYKKNWDSYAISFSMGIYGLAAFCSYPLDTVSRRMMMKTGEKQKYKGIRHCLQTIVNTEGYRSLFNGAGTHVFTNLASMSLSTSLLYLIIMSPKNIS